MKGFIGVMYGSLLPNGTPFERFYRVQQMRHRVNTTRYACGNSREQQQQQHAVPTCSNLVMSVRFLRALADGLSPGVKRPELSGVTKQGLYRLERFVTYPER